MAFWCRSCILSMPRSSLHWVRFIFLITYIVLSNYFVVLLCMIHTVWTIERDYCEISICDGIDCLNGGTCAGATNPLQPECLCTSSYTGNRPVPDCLSLLDGNIAILLNTVFNLKRCEILVACENFCENGGICSEKNGNPTCDCLPNFYGANCEYANCDAESCQSTLILANTSLNTTGTGMPKEASVVFNQRSKPYIMYSL